MNEETPADAPAERGSAAVDGAPAAAHGTAVADVAPSVADVAPSAAEGDGALFAPPEGAQSDRIEPALEAILMVVDEPVPVGLLAQTLGCPVDAVTRALRGLADDYTAAGRGFELRQLAGGWRVYTRSEYAPYVERFVLEGQQARLTQAALETLAVIAYKQPVTRSAVAAIRGVSVDGVIRTLLSRGLIEECGTDPETGGYQFRTTVLFLEKLGLNSLDELPALAPLLPGMDALDDVIAAS
ncbi:SMC-Scp complex subunit ScpB [Cryptosporangium minutisporangium]|uniref:SMC-Scp complex subunit ScpB n=1 Tax=Cryptosporangium minutisporangium TaxID=113569 RepID=A0ABP6T1E9_9ACTN